MQLPFDRPRSSTRRSAEIVDYRATTGGAAQTAPDEPIVQASLTAGRAHGAGRGGQAPLPLFDAGARFGGGRENLGVRVL